MELNICTLHTDTSNVPVDLHLKVKPMSARAEQRENKKKELTDLRRTVFVGNLPLTATVKDVKKLFKQFGSIESVRLRSVISADRKLPKKAALAKKAFADNKDNFNAYVRFKTEDDAKKSLSMNNTQFKDHHIRVDYCSKTGKKYSGKTTVFIGNLPYTVTDEELRGHFGDCGDVELVRIVRDKYTGIGKGFAFLGFKDSSAVPLALRLSGHKFMDRELRVTRVAKKNKQSKQKVDLSTSKQRLQGLKRKRPSSKLDQKVLGKSKKPKKNKKGKSAKNQQNQPLL